MNNVDDNSDDNSNDESDDNSDDNSNDNSNDESDDNSDDNSNDSNDESDEEINKIIMKKQIIKMFKKFDTITCQDCKKKYKNITTTTLNIWKNKKLCDKCYSKYNDEKNKLWDLVQKYKPHICIFCKTQKMNNDDRYHYDHINMFNKNNNICTMVKEGFDINLIYKELDKCQSVCLYCHHKITFFEREYGFIDIKQYYNKLYKTCIIDENKYNEKINKLNKKYQKIMKNVYDLLKPL